MSEAEICYNEYGGCSCHECAPCSFCMLLTEEESDIRWNGGMEKLRVYWKEKSLQPSPPVIEYKPL